MPEQPSARDKILDAFVKLLIADGERSATLDAVAARAGVSKGGLLYHFKSKEALTAGLIEKLRSLADADFEAMRAAPDGPALFYVAGSVYENTEFDRVLIASTRLVHGQDPLARETLQRIQQTWYEIILAEVADPAIARAILLLGDGLYYHAALLGEGAEAAGGSAGIGVEDLLRVVRLLKAQAAEQV